MQSIGERFEEARKRKGISLREASEATKIRSDFLDSIEQNKFDFDLPEIYKAGFVKNYANYLQLDAQSIVADYKALLLNNSRIRKKGVSELFGPINVDTNTEPSLGRISTTQQSNDIEEDDDVEHSEDIDKAFYIKLALVIAGVITFVVIIIGLIAAILSGDKDPVAETSGAGTSQSVDRSSETSTSNVSSSEAETISLIASGNVFVLVKQRDNNEELVRRTLGEGETLEFTKNGPVDVFFTAGEHLVIVDPDGKRMRPSKKGTAKISIP